MTSHVDLSIELCGVRFPNPFLLSSSPVGNSAEMIARAFDAGWGGVVYKTLNWKDVTMIHPSPRMEAYNYEGKRLVGLQNVEMTSDRTLEENLLDILWLKKHYPDRPVVASIMGFCNEEWGWLARACEDNGADMLELNFSCPHMSREGGGHKIGQSFHLLEKFTETVRNACSLPIIAKMTPNITDMTEPAMYAKNGGADAISAINTVRAIADIDLDAFVPRLNVFGKGAISGYSGPAVKPIGLRFIAELAQCEELGLPLSGIGGIETWVDALEYILVGASTVQVTSGIIHYGYRIVEDLIEGLSDYMKLKGFTSVSELVGRALPNIVETDRFDVKRQGVATFDLDRCVGCGQCYIVCRDAGGQALEWDSDQRRPVHDEDRCLSCMICAFVCPVEELIRFKEMPPDWKRARTITLGAELKDELKL
jgi:dihydropyrimidine dehydrogenase (NAD+) subunit PreA